MALAASQRFSRFEPEKAVAAIGFLIASTGESLYTLMKMMYLADRLHLTRYGRYIAGDNYTAMREGPVPSITYDLMKFVRGDRQNVPGTELASRALQYVGDHMFTVKSAPRIEELSESDVECLQEVADLLKKFGSKAIRDMSHDEAWSAKRTVLARILSCDMTIEDVAAHTENSAALLAHVRDTHPGSV